MPTIDLSTPPPAAPTLLEALPRRVTLTLRELQRVAAAAGGAPLPFDLAGAAGVDAPDGSEAGASEAGGLADRLGGGSDAGADPSSAAYAAALASLHDADESLARRGLLLGDQVDDGLVGAVGLLATPEVALDLDVAVGGLRARAWHRQAGDAVATLATVDGLVFELAWFGVAQWPLELGRVAVLPEDLAVGDSAVPARLDVPYELLDAVGEALRSDRADLLPVLVAQQPGALLDERDAPLDEVAATGALAALVGETRGRLRALVADVSGAETTVAGVVSWVLLDDGWHALRPHTLAGAHRVEVVRVEPAGLAADLAPVLAEVS
ncbi:hypothetical protein I601_1503 [Nocardioides dokdonensis FR1436]|uniref:Uncharacterized protein n=1 Tax=Nocardioides dokdonensis FR1436 TaxID=1300347 RepID=A0A1A9GI23_9ACTN|nr:hypothetical protein [Nocardioides dokdonensis]ANH37938.1 hypothetical protein I601_1503 [Nocardioides dokdonensis FR1436]